MPRLQEVENSLSAVRPGSPLEARLQAEMERLLGGPLDDRRWKAVGKALATLHKRFVAELPPEEPFPDYHAERAGLAAYLAYFFPASRAQVARALAELAPPAGPLRVLDVGAGPGPGAFAAADRARARVDVTALDASAAALDSLRNLWDPSKGALSVKVWRAADPLPEGPFDLVIASHVFNEAFAGDPARMARRDELARALASRLAPQGVLLLLEPALKRTGRELLVLRDRLAEKGMAVLAPCLWQGGCPAIQRPRDWCHADRPWTPPPLTQRAAAEAGLARESLKFAWVAMAKTHPDPARTRDTSLFRIVSEPLPEKGKLRYFGCGPAGRHPLVRLDRDATETNAAFGRLERGDVVRLGPTTPSGDGKRLGAGTSVVSETPARALDLPGAVSEGDGAEGKRERR